MFAGSTKRLYSSWDKGELPSIIKIDADKDK